MRKNVLLTLVCALAAGIMVSGCSANDSCKSAALEESSETLKDESAQEVKAPEDCMVIETKYGNLYYPDQWTEHVQINQEEFENGIEVSFVTVINEQQYPLFEVIVGEWDGTKVGELTDSSGMANSVYIQLEEIQTDSDLSEAEQNRLYAMQEDLNYLIDHLD